MIRPLILMTLATLSLGACASTKEPQETYGAALDRIAGECQARGGILVPSGAQTARPQADNVCKVNGGASRLNQQH